MRSIEQPTRNTHRATNKKHAQSNQQKTRTEQPTRNTHRATNKKRAQSNQQETSTEQPTRNEHRATNKKHAQSNQQETRTEQPTRNTHRATNKKKTQSNQQETHTEQPTRNTQRATNKKHAESNQTIQHECSQFMLPRLFLFQKTCSIIGLINLNDHYDRTAKVAVETVLYELCSFPSIYISLYSLTLALCHLRATNFVYNMLWVLRVTNLNGLPHSLLSYGHLILGERACSGRTCMIKKFFQGPSNGRYIPWAVPEDSGYWLSGVLRGLSANG